jgi:F-type H+-transporting ATPase subunit epsilon
MAYMLQLEIVTPEAKAFSGDVDMVTLSGVEGEMGIMPGHMPVMTQLVAGELIVRQGGQSIFIAVGDGFVQITGEKVSVLTDMAIKADDIDEAKALEAQRKAEARLAQILSEEETATVQAALVRATTQLHVKRHHQKQ